MFFSNQVEVFGRADVLQRHPDLHQGHQDDDQAFDDPLLRGEEGGTFGPPVAFKLRVHAAVDPVQQAIDVIPGHIHLLVLEKIRTRGNKRRDSDFLAQHELRDFSSVTGAVVEECTCIHRLGVLLVAKLQNHLIYSRMGNSWLAAVGWGIQDYPKMLGAKASIYLTRIDSHSDGNKIFYVMF